MVIFKMSAMIGTGAILGAFTPPPSNFQNPEVTRNTLSTLPFPHSSFSDISGPPGGPRLLQKTKNLNLDFVNLILSGVPGVDQVWASVVGEDGLLDSSQLFYPGSFMDFLS